MGARGPVPKRSTERRRRNKDSEPEKVTRLVAKPKPPRAKATWHPIMKRWFSALGRSAQATFYEPSDWAEAELWCEVMSIALKSKKGVSAFMLQAFSSFSTRLLTTEGDRRRVRLEISDEPTKPAKVTNLAQFRARAGA